MYILFYGLSHHSLGAAYKNREEVVKLLLKYNANINHKDNKGLTPLHWAASGNHDNTVDLLVIFLLVNNTYNLVAQRC